MNIFGAIKAFYKYAIKDYPDWLRDDYKKELEAIEKIEKHPLLKDFRDKLSNDEIQMIIGNTPKDYEKSLLRALEVAFDEFCFRFRKNPKYKAEIDIIDDYACMDLIHKLTDLRNNKITHHNKTKPTKLVKFYNYINNIFIKEGFSDYAEEFKNLPGAIDWDRRFAGGINVGYDLVFTTNPSDILGMSSRNQWRSCQDLRPDSRWLDSTGWHAVSSCESKYVGIIYVTDGSDFEGRGEKMLYRSTVYLLRKIENPDEYGIFIAKVYPGESPNELDIKRIFLLHLKKNLGVDPIWENPANDYGYVMEEKNPTMTPYFDSHVNRIYSKEYVIEKINEGFYDIILQAKPEWDEYYEMAKKAIDYNIRYIAFINQNWDGFDEMAKMAIDKSPKTIDYIGEYYPGFEGFLRYMVNTHNFYTVWEALPFLNWSRYKNTLKYAIKKDKKYLKYANPLWDDYEEFVRLAEKNG